jgi:hypothetical protein
VSITDRKLAAPAVDRTLQSARTANRAVYDVLCQPSHHVETSADRTSTSIRRPSRPAGRPRPPTLRSHLGGSGDPHHERLPGRLHHPRAHRGPAQGGVQRDGLQDERLQSAVHRPRGGVDGDRARGVTTGPVPTAQDDGAALAGAAPSMLWVGGRLAYGSVRFILTPPSISVT